MIVFFEKKTGKIIGSINGRVHPKAHLDMWIGDKKNTDRLIVEWKPVKKGEEIVEKNVIVGYKKSKDGFDEAIVGKITQKVKVIDYEPKTKQKDLFIDIDSKKKRIYDFKVDLKTKELKKK
jgi:hypothetical protein